MSATTSGRKVKTAATTIVEYPVYEEWISRIAADKSIADILQPRTCLDFDWVSDYAGGYERGDPIPPLVAFRLPNGRLVLVDGFHRLEALWRQHKGEKDFKVRVQVREGTHTEALVYAIAANQAKLHKGRPFTKEDKVRSVELMIQNGAGQQGKGSWDWSDKEISRQCSVSPTAVQNIRLRLREQSQIPLPDRVRLFGINGKPNGETSRYQKSRSTESPPIQRIPNGQHRVRLNGKTVYLGTDPAVAQSKLDAIVSKQNDYARSLDSTTSFQLWLNSMAIYSFVVSNCPVGGVQVGDNMIYPVANNDSRSLLATIAQGMMVRIVLSDVLRVVLAGYFGSVSGQAGQIINLAKQLSPPIEFMTPEEVVAEFGGVESDQPEE